MRPQQQQQTLQPPNPQRRRQSMDSRSYSIGGESDNSILDRMADTLDRHQSDDGLGSTSCCSFRNFRRSSSVGRTRGSLSHGNNHTTNNNSNLNNNLNTINGNNRYLQIQDDRARPAPRPSTPSVASDTFHVEDEEDLNEAPPKRSLESKRSLGSSTSKTSLGSSTSYTHGSSSSFSDQFAAMDLGKGDQKLSRQKSNDRIDQGEKSKSNSQKMRRSSSARSLKTSTRTTSTRREGPAPKTSTPEPRVFEIPVIDSKKEQQQKLSKQESLNPFPDTVDFSEDVFPPPTIKNDRQTTQVNKPPPKNKDPLERPSKESRRRSSSKPQLGASNKTNNPVINNTSVPAASTLTTRGSSVNHHRHYKTRRHSLERKERSASPKKRTVRQKSTPQNPPVRNRIEQQMQEQAHLLRMQLQQQQHQQQQLLEQKEQEERPDQSPNVISSDKSSLNSPVVRIRPQLPEITKSPIVITAIAPKSHLRESYVSQSDLQPPVTISHSFAESAISQITFDDQNLVSGNAEDHDSSPSQKEQPIDVMGEEEYVSMSTLDDEEYRSVTDHSRGHFSLVENEDEEVLSAITCSVMSASVAASNSTQNDNLSNNEAAFYSARGMVDEMDHEIHERMKKTTSTKKAGAAVVSPETRPKRKVSKKSKVVIQFEKERMNTSMSGENDRMDDDDNSESAVTEQ